MSQLGRLDGYRVTYAGLPSARNEGSTACTSEIFATPEGAAGALRARQLFPGEVQAHEVNFGSVGDGTRTFEGKYTDSSGHSSNFVYLEFLRGRFVGSVTIVGSSPEQARLIAQNLAASMDSRMATYSGQPTGDRRADEPTRISSR